MPNYNLMTSLQREHALMVNNNAKRGEDIIATMLPAQAHLLHMAVGVCGEAGELIDAIKKHVVYGKPLDFENVIEEIGDIEFYLSGLRDALDIERDTTLRHNLNKLAVRYARGYSDAAAQVRADKADDVALMALVDPQEEKWAEDSENCLHPKLIWGGLSGYVCELCGEPAASIREDIA